ncbi:nuclear transcription factor Y subunit A-3-like isoform X2 [Salvia miltiorrhiza]|nr:nuclear transcription factor Y subunit A-3-like isoform X2 [Salvia miltiorrhiza]XP_057766769.1 nuclear transcription factor Y subunit A-3-like isoform X2 [Salvia miltiorrhiza]
MHEQHFSQTISKNLNFEVDCPPQRGQEVKYIDFQLQDQHSSSTESTSLSHKEFTAMGKAGSQDQCASSDSVHDESYGKHGQHMKGGLFLCNPELSINVSHAEITQPIVQLPYAYADPYFTGLFTPYGPHNIIQPQMMAAASGRVPLPVDLPEDGPIYVNAKQYHGILRRRQTRAKLEAQNKLVKTRKPYLHESRHQHALNRVRGSGGRFLSTKKQQSEALAAASAGGVDAFHFGYGEGGGDGTRVSGGGDAILQQSDGRFTSMASHSGGMVYNGNRCYASIVR